MPSVSARLFYSATCGTSRPHPRPSRPSHRSLRPRFGTRSNEASGSFRKPRPSTPHHRSCFSCHHQTLPMLAVVKARAQGVAIEPDLLQEQAEFSVESFGDKVREMSTEKGSAEPR